MLRTYEAEIDEQGNVHFAEPISLGRRLRAWVTIIEDVEKDAPNEAALLSERALAQDWDREEEDIAWAHLQ